MKSHSMRALYSIAVLALLAGCSLPTGGGAGPRTWIDDPLPGTYLPLGPVIVQSHAASDSGTASAALLVNGATVRLDNAVNPSDPLTSFSQTWEPSTPGDYTLVVVSTGSGGGTGRSNPVLVHVGVSAQEVTAAPEDVATAVLTPPPSATFTPEVTITFTPAVNADQSPRFTFTINANCRAGPSTLFEAVTSFYAGDQVTIEGTNDDSTWFWILIPNSQSHCFVSGSTGAPTGSLAGLVVVTVAAPVVPPTTVVPPPSEPASPGNFSVGDKSCSASGYVVTLQWDDVDGELGYYVYRDGKQVAMLSANATSYEDVSPDFNPHSYQVAAYNKAGSAKTATRNSSGCVY